MALKYISQRRTRGGKKKITHHLIEYLTNLCYVEEKNIMCHVAYLKQNQSLLSKGIFHPLLQCLNLLHCRLRSRKSMHSTFSSLKDTWGFSIFPLFLQQTSQMQQFSSLLLSTFFNSHFPYNLRNLKDKTILKNICFQIKNLIERQQSIFDRHETIAYTLNGMTTEQLQICNSSKCHLHTKVNKIYHLIHQIFSLEFIITEMHVQQCSMRI